MIQPLRTLHRHVMVALAVVLPAAFVAGLAARRWSEPPNQGIHWIAPPEGVAWRPASVQRIGGAVVNRRRSVDGAWIEATPVTDILEPDLLVYVSPDETVSHGRLLGTLAGRNAQWYRVGKESADGYVTVFSLAHQAALGRVALRNLP